MGINPKVSRIDSHDDLPLPGHQWLVQIAVGASEIHFKNIFLSTVTISIRTAILQEFPHSNRGPQLPILIGKFTFVDFCGIKVLF